MVDARRIAKRGVADRIGDDLCNVAFAIAQRPQGFRHRLVDDLEIATTGKLFELHQRKVRFNAGRVAIHHKPDRAGGRDDGGLSIAVAMLFTQRHRFFPRLDGALRHIGIGKVGMVERHRADRQLVITLGVAACRIQMVSHHAQHRLTVGCKTGEGAKLTGHFR